MILLHKNSLKKHLTLMLLLIATYLTEAQTPVAHYPLSVETIHTRDPRGFIDKSFWIAKVPDAFPYDISGYGKHLTIQDFVQTIAGTYIRTYNYEATPIGKRFGLQKNTDPFDIEYPGLYNSGDDFSVSLWVKMPAAGAAGTLIKDQAFTVEVESSSSSGTYQFKITFPGNVGSIVVGTITGNTWYNLSFTYQNSSKTVNAYVHDFQGSLNDNNLNVLSASPIVNKTITSSMLQTGMIGYALHNIKFFDVPVTASRIKKMVSEDLDYFQERTTGLRYMQYSLKPVFDHPFTGGGKGDRFGTGDAGEMSSAITIPSPNTISSYFTDGWAYQRNHVDGNLGALGTGANFDHYNKGATISFWIKVTQNWNEKDHTTFNSSGTTNYLEGKDGSGNLLFGVGSKNSRIGVWRYAKRADNTKHPYFLWFLDNASLNHRNGWVHIVIVSDQLFTKAYVLNANSDLDLSFKKWGNAYSLTAEELKAWAQAPLRKAYFPTQDLSSVTDWKIPANPGVEIDDFKIYNWPMTDEQVKDMHSDILHPLPLQPPVGATPFPWKTFGIGTGAVTGTGIAAYLTYRNWEGIKAGVNYIRESIGQRPADFEQVPLDEPDPELGYPAVDVAKKCL